MFLRKVVVFLVLFTTMSCTLITGEDALVQARIKHQLNILQISLESYLKDKPEQSVELHASPVEDEDSDTSEAGSGHPVDTATEVPAASHNDSGTTSVSVVAIVDSLLLVPATEGEELDPALQDSALRRERLVRTALGNNLYENKFFQIIQPTPEQRDQTRKDLIASNGASLAPKDAATAGMDIGVDHLIWAIIENEGRDVNVVAQRVDNGVVVFNETLVGWDIFEATGNPGEE